MHSPMVLHSSMLYHSITLPSSIYHSSAIHHLQLNHSPIVDCTRIPSSIYHATIYHSLLLYHCTVFKVAVFTHHSTMGKFIWGDGIRNFADLRVATIFFYLFPRRNDQCFFLLFLTPIAHISPHRHQRRRCTFFQAGVLFSIENAKFWPFGPILAILSQICVVFGELL